MVRAADRAAIGSVCGERFGCAMHGDSDSPQLQRARGGCPMAAHACAAMGAPDSQSPAPLHPHRPPHPTHTPSSLHARGAACAAPARPGLSGQRRRAPRPSARPNATQRHLSAFNQFALTDSRPGQVMKKTRIRASVQTFAKLRSISSSHHGIARARRRPRAPRRPAGARKGKRPKKHSFPRQKSQASLGKGRKGKGLNPNGRTRRVFVLFDSAG